MTTENIILLAILLVILLETSYIMYKIQRQQTRSKNTSVYVDTSVLIDGRILAIAETGFITAELVIPRSVISELQLLADGSDHEKRSRARNGLDIAQKLRECEAVTVTLLQDGAAKEGVDERLLQLAKKHGGMICTIDYNLNKVAQVEGIRVLNVNELAKNVRLLHLPGEVRSIELTQKGQDSHQGIGYIEDGTMVVVENASRYIGKTVDVEFIRALQTDAGKMMFAKMRNTTHDTKKATAKPNKSIKGRRTNERANVSPVSTRQSQAASPKSVKSRTHSSHKQTKKSSASSEDRLINLVENQR